MGIFRGFKLNLRYCIFGHWSSALWSFVARGVGQKCQNTIIHHIIIIHNSDNPCQHLGSKLGESNKQDFSTTNYLENYTMLFWQLWLVLVVKLLEMNSNGFSRQWIVYVRISQSLKKPFAVASSEFLHRLPVPTAKSSIADPSRRNK